MTSRITRKNGATPDDNGDEPDSLVSQILSPSTSVTKLQSIAVRLYRQDREKGATLETMREAHGKMCKQMDALLEPEQHSVIVTGFEQNGCLKAEVAGPASNRTWVNVHPDVDPALVKEGARGWLSRARNCLLSVDSRPVEWRDVGTFERALDDQRILVRFQQHLITLKRAASLHGTELTEGDSVGMDRDAGLAFERLPPPDRQGLFAETIPSDDFRRLGGLDAQVHEIKTAISFCFQHADVAARYGLGSKRSILMIGPPGTGKTQMARCCAGYVQSLLPSARCRLMCVEASEDNSVWFGESEAKIRERFAAIRDASREGPVIAFFDEIDALGRRRGMDMGSSAPDRILNTFLCQLGGIQNLENVLILAATNRADVLDAALTRPGRFDLKIQFPNPNRAGARTILRHYLKGLPVREPGIDAIVEAVLGRIYSPRGVYSEVLHVKLADNRLLAIPAKAFFSGAMIESVVKFAAERAAEREIAGGEPGLGEPDLLDAIDRQIRGTLATLSPDNVKAYVSTIPADARPVAVTVLDRPNVLEYARRGA